MLELFYINKSHPTYRHYIVCVCDLWFATSFIVLHFCFILIYYIHIFDQPVLYLQLTKSNNSLYISSSNTVFPEIIEYLTFLHKYQCWRQLKT